MPRKTVQICGKAPTPLGIPAVVGAERWIIGSSYDEHVTWDRAFDVHPFAWIHDRRPQAWTWYQQQTQPIYLVVAVPEIPSSRTFPRAAIRAAFGARAVNAFSSSVDHMIALALLEGFETIRLDGVRMNSVEEWHGQRECLAYWIGKAEWLGVEVITDPEAALCTPERVYGFDEPTGAVRSPGAPVIVYGVPGVYA